MGDEYADREAERLRKVYSELERKKNKFSFSFPYRLRFPIAWTLFFAVVGIVIQSLVEKRFVFIEFFSSNYLAWFHSFGDFSSTYKASGIEELIIMILKQPYFFFFNGGLLSIIWEIIYILTHVELKVKRNEFNPGAI